MNKPQITREQIQKILDKRNIKDQLLVIGIRGFMAKKGQANSRGIYDDAICIVAPHGFATFNGNTDPSAYRKGSGHGAAKGMASLNPGFYHAHQLGLHRGKYMALIQTGGPVDLTRDGNPPYLELKTWAGINIHKGGVNGTSSLGCQTLEPQQWPAFIAMVQNEMHALKQSVMPYLLLEAKDLA